MFENDTYNLYTIETKKFKSVHAEVVFKTPATKESITYLSLLTSVLLESTLEYPSKKLLSRHLSDLYNADAKAMNSRVGGAILTHFAIDFLDPKYIDAETVEDAIKLLFDIVLKPNAHNGEFDEIIFERVKKRIQIEIESLKEDPKQSSILSALKELDPTDIRSVNAAGDLEILDTITPRKLYKYYEEFIESSSRDVYMVGSFNSKEMNKTIRKYATFKSIPREEIEIALPEIKIKKEKSKVQESELTQTNLVQIYSLTNLTDFECDYAMPLYNMIMGSGSLESKLYKSLREENSLCYNVSTFYQKYDHTLILHTAIDEESTSLATKLIKNAFGEMAKGQVSEEELANVKNILISSLSLILDSPSRLCDMYLFRNLTGLPDIETRIDEIKKVKLEDLVKLSKKINLVLNFRMRGE